MKVFLVGFMGAGKTQVGLKLSEKLGIEFVDMDVVIEELEGISISEIFEKNGEPAFRESESEVVSQLISRPGDSVIACGGGTPCYKDNMKNMCDAGTVVYLDTPFETLANRVGDKPGRPLWSNADSAEVEKRFNERIPFYEKADIQVSTDQETVDNIADKIAAQLKES